MKNKLSPSDEALFRQAMRGVKPLATKAKVSAPPPSLPPRRKTVVRENEPLPPSATFSDHEYLDLVDSDEVLYFARPGLPAKMLREFKRGQGEVEAVLDLHGMTVDEARESLQQFLSYCQQEAFRQVVIIHGKGRGTSKPILKNKLNHWLRQSSQVLVFCSAKPKDGGTGALYVRLKRS